MDRSPVLGVEGGDSVEWQGEKAGEQQGGQGQFADGIGELAHDLSPVACGVALCCVVIVLQPPCQRQTDRRNCIINTLQTIC